MTFDEAYALCGPDVERVAYLLGIAPSEADRLINKRMDEKHARRVKDERVRTNLREIRARRPA